MTVEIKDWNQRANDFQGRSFEVDDGTFGYNDYVLTIDDRGILPVDEANDTLANPQASLPTEDQVRAELRRIGANGTIQATDHVYRMVRDGRTYFILHRSRTTDDCNVTSRPNNALTISEPLANALAFFGSRVHGSDPSGQQWCRRHVDGISEDAIETPWDVSSMYNLRSIQQVIGRIQATRSGNLPSDIPQADQARARQLANAVTADELSRLSTDINGRIERLEGFGEWFMRHPVLHTLGIAALFGIGTDAYHWVRYFFGGGQSPWHGPDKAPFTRMIRWIVDRFRGPRPPQGPTGGSPTGGGGGGNEPVRAPAPEVATGERSAFEINSTAYWIGAVGAATLLAGIFHFRGRAREAEVRNGEVRVREAAEIRLRDIAVQAPAAARRIEGAGGGATRLSPGEAFRLLGARPDGAH